MKRKIMVGLALLAIIGVSTGFYMFNKKVPGLENAKADFSLTANALFDEFDASELPALNKYEGKILDVTGEVVSVKNKDGQSNIILLAENAMAGGINCSFKSKQTDLKKGDTATIRGRCQGFLMDVVLNNCNQIK